MVFDNNWITRAQNCADQRSWVKEVIKQLNASGGKYLRCIRDWVDAFPLNEEQKRQLIVNLENFQNEPHLGAVNELAWWKLLQREHFTIKPIPAENSPRPDFCITAPSEFFAEVSTLNFSQQDICSFQNSNFVSFDPASTIKRIEEKIMSEKKRKQILYATAQAKPIVVVLFDYSFQSNFGTEFYLGLGNALLGEQRGFQRLPVELSALVYVERKVLHGHIAISRVRSAAYYNPHVTDYPLPLGTFKFINQFWDHMQRSQPVSYGNTYNDWICL